MRDNATKAKLKAGETVYGVFTRYPNATLIEVMAYQPWDFILFDGEHGNLQPADCENMVRATELRGVTSMVRVTTNQPSIILRFMDTGVQGLHVPWVNTAAEAEAVVQSVKYHPRGIRGLAGIRAADYGQVGTFADYTQKANAETLVVIQVETIQAVDELPKMVEIDGVDVVFIGPTDLSHSLGVPGQQDHPDVQAAMGRIADIVTKSDKALGIMVGNAQGARRWRDRGARYITTTFEALLAPATRDYLNAARS